MTKKVSLTHAERLEISKVLNTSKFNTLEDMAFALEDAKAIAHSPEEIKEINLHTINNDQNIAWTEDGKEKEIDLSDTCVSAVFAEIKRKEEAKDITIGDQALLSLQNKLK